MVRRGLRSKGSTLVPSQRLARFGVVDRRTRDVTSRLDAFCTLVTLGL
jgi:hypothetical protein